MSTPDPVRAALAELEDAITLEGFGCACTPHATCATCRTRNTLATCVRKEFDKLRAALSAQPPSGWLLVPVEPTPDMCMAALVASREAGAVHGGNYAMPIARLAELVLELQYGLERALAQRDDEGDRLDWLMVKLAGSVTRELLGVMSHTGDPAEFRRRIDEVRGTPARCVRETAPGRACGLMPPCPDCGRACHDVPEGA